eukprot:COSAG04_NODE_23756_length_333_cov_0.444444_1_plen_49_part_00
MLWGRTLVVRHVAQRIELRAREFQRLAVEDGGGHHSVVRRLRFGVAQP